MKYVAKGPKIHLEVLKNELDTDGYQVKSYETRHRCDHAKNYSEELLINGFSFLTESDRILGGGLFKR